MAPGIPNQDEVLLNHPDSQNPYQYPNYGGGIHWLNPPTSQQPRQQHFEQESTFDDYTAAP